MTEISGRPKYLIAALMWMPLVAFGLVGSAHAERHVLMTMTAEKFPGDVFTFGVNADVNHQIESVFYTDSSLKPQNQPNPFLMSDLAKGVVIIKAKGYELIKLTLTHTGENEYLADLDYMTNGLTQDRVHNYLAARWNAQRADFDVFFKGSGYQAKRLPNGKQINQAYVETRRWFGVEVGIRTIQFY